MFMVMATEIDEFISKSHVPDKYIFMTGYGPYTLTEALDMIEDNFIKGDYSVYIQELPEKNEIPEFAHHYINVTDAYQASLYSVKESEPEEEIIEDDSERERRLSEKDIEGIMVVSADMDMGLSLKKD